MTDRKYYSSSRYTEPRATSSRRVKVEQSKLFHQTILLVIGAVVLMILSVFVIIPGVLRVVGSLSNSPADVEEALPPQTPILAAPVPATSSASLAISGFTTRDAEVIILKNATQDKSIFADGEGNFSASITLDKGENVITAFAKNDTKESEVSQSYIVILDDEKPIIEVEEPQEGQSIQGKKNQTITVKGKTEPKSRLTLNDRLIFANEDGTFSASHRLENGENVLNFKSTDEAENVTELQRKVTFSE